MTANTNTCVAQIVRFPSRADFGGTNTAASARLVALQSGLKPMLTSVAGTARALRRATSSRSAGRTTTRSSSTARHAASARATRRCAATATSSSPFARGFRGIKLADVDRPMARKFANARPRSAVVVRNMFSDAVDDGLIDANPFANLQLEQARGRSRHPTITEEELHDLADAGVVVLGGVYGQVYRSFILATGYVSSTVRGFENLRDP